MKQKRLSKAMLAVVLIAAMLATMAAPAGIGTRMAAAEEMTGKIIDTAVQTVSFDTNAGIENMYTSENSSKKVSDEERGTVLELGLSKLAERTRGVLLKNPFKGNADLVESLAKTLENNGVVYNGSSADLVTLHDQHGNAYLGLDVNQIPMEGRTYPFPKHTTGVSISAWVKVPEAATADAPILTFTRADMEQGVGGLTLNLSGNVTFHEGTTYEKGSPSAAKNAVGFEYDTMKEVKSDMLSKKGHWVYVTVVIMDDWIDVYFDGQPTEASVRSDYKTGKHFVKNFNRGFSYRGALESNPPEIYKNYRCLIDGFTQEEKDAGNFSDFSKYRFLNSSQDTIMEYLIDEETTFYVGGDKESMGHGTALYNDAAAGVRVDDISFFTEPLSAQEVAQLYAEVKPAAVETSAPTETPVVTETPMPTETPVVTETPMPTETPVVTETPMPTETPVVTETPMPTETPVVTETPMPTETPVPVEYWYGDVDKNGNVTAEDALSILKHVVKLQLIEDEVALILADVTKDGAIEAVDALEVLKIVVKLRESEKYIP